MMALIAAVEAATEPSMRRAGSKDAPSLLNVLIRTLDKKEFSLQVCAQACGRLPLTSSQTRSGATAGGQGACSCWVQKGRRSPGTAPATAWSAARARPRARARARVLAGLAGACLLVCVCEGRLLKGGGGAQVRSEISVQELKRELASATSIAVESQRLMS